VNAGRGWLRRHSVVSKAGVGRSVLQFGSRDAAAQIGTDERHNAPPFAGIAPWLPPLIAKTRTLVRIPPNEFELLSAANDVTTRLH